MTFDSPFQINLSYDLIMIPVLLDDTCSQDTTNLLENFQADLMMTLTFITDITAFILAFWKELI